MCSSAFIARNRPVTTSPRVAHRARRQTDVAAPVIRTLGCHDAVTTHPKLPSRRPRTPPDPCNPTHRRSEPQFCPRVSPLGWWDFGAEADRVREGLGVSLRVLGWAIA